MNIYSGKYDEDLGCCEYREYSFILVAETKQVALGLALEAVPDSKAKYWEIEKIDHTCAGAHYV